MQNPSNACSESTLRLVCAQVWGGNRPVHTTIELPGVRGLLFSHPCDGGRGGDVHYLSVCSAGLLSRMCLADVAGHGRTVAAISSEIHHHLQRSMNRPDQRRVLSELNERIGALGFKAMTTAAAATYYTPTQRLMVSYAGHPPGWFCCRREHAWTRLDLEETEGLNGLHDMPLGIENPMGFTVRTVRVGEGDRVAFVTDGVLETPSTQGDHFGEQRVGEVLSRHGSRSCKDLGEALLDSLERHAGGNYLAHDDVSFLIVEFVRGPRGPAIWHYAKNQLGRLLRSRAIASEAEACSLE